jgi:hypothetical protein
LVVVDGIAQKNVNENKNPGDFPALDFIDRRVQAETAAQAKQYGREVDPKLADGDFQ